MYRGPSATLLAACTARYKADVAILEKVEASPVPLGDATQRTILAQRDATKGLLAQAAAEKSSYGTATPKSLLLLQEGLKELDALIDTDIKASREERLKSMEDTSAMLMRDFNLLRAHPMEETEIDALKLIRRAISAVEKGLKEEGPVMSAYELVDELAEMQGFVTDSRELFDKFHDLKDYNSHWRQWYAPGVAQSSTSSPPRRRSSTRRSSAAALAVEAERLAQNFQHHGHSNSLAHGNHSHVPNLTDRQARRSVSQAHLRARYGHE